MNEDDLPYFGSELLENLHRSRTLFGTTRHAALSDVATLASEDNASEEVQQTDRTRHAILRHVSEIEAYLASLLDRRDYLFSFQLVGDVAMELDVAIAKGCLTLAAGNADAALRLLACGDWQTAAVLMGRARSLVQSTGSSANVAADTKHEGFVKAMVAPDDGQEHDNRRTPSKYRAQPAGRVIMKRGHVRGNELVVGNATTATVEVCSDAYLEAVTEHKRRDYLYGFNGDPYGLGRALWLHPEKLQGYFRQVMQLVAAANVRLERTSNTGQYLGGRTAMERVLLPPGIANPRSHCGAPLTPHPPSSIGRTHSRNGDIDGREANDEENHQSETHDIEVLPVRDENRVALVEPRRDIPSDDASLMRVYLPAHRLRVPTRPVATEAGPPQQTCVYGHGRVQRPHAASPHSDDGNDSELEACGIVPKRRRAARRGAAPKLVRQSSQSPTRKTRMESLRQTLSIESPASNPRSPAVKSSPTKRYKRRSVAPSAVSERSSSGKSVSDSLSVSSSVVNSQYDEPSNDSDLSPLASPFLLSPAGLVVVVHEIVGRRAAGPGSPSTEQPLPLDVAASPRQPFSSSTSFATASFGTTSFAPTPGESFEDNRQNATPRVAQKSVPLVSKDSRSGAFPVFEGKLATLEAPGARSRRSKLPSRRRAVAKRRSILMSPDLSEREKKRIILKTVLTIQRWYRRTTWWVDARDTLVSLRFERRRGRRLLQRCYIGFACRVHLATTFRRDRAIIRLQYAYRRYRAEKRLRALQQARDVYLHEKERQDGLMDRIVYLMRCQFHAKKALHVRKCARDEQIEQRIGAEQHDVDQMLACETLFHHSLHRRVEILNRNMLSRIAVADPNLYHAPSLRVLEEQQQRHAVIVEMHALDQRAIHEERWWAQRIIAKYFRRYQCRAELERRRAEAMFDLLIRSHHAVKTDMVTPALVEEGRWGTTVYTALRGNATASVAPSLSSR